MSVCPSLDYGESAKPFRSSRDTPLYCEEIERVFPIPPKLQRIAVNNDGMLEQWYGTCYTLNTILNHTLLAILLKDCFFFALKPFYKEHPSLLEHKGCC